MIFWHLDGVKNIMKCKICKKNEANIVFTQIIDNEKIVLQICAECAKQKGLSIEIEKALSPSSASHESFLGSLTGQLWKKEEDNIPDLKCGVCGLTFAEFKKSGLFGCDKCHEAFGEHIKKLLKQIHGTAVHEGKTPEVVSKNIGKKQHLKELKADLKNCVKIEDYERAAKLRDRIAEIQKEKSL